jgi:hypothetical protein
VGAPSKRDAANAHALRGQPVFPVLPNSKTPGVRWTEWANFNTAKIDAYWLAHPDSNIGMPMGYPDAKGRKVFAIDVDVKNGNDGFAVIQELERVRGDLPGTFRRDTPTGGAHLVFTSIYDFKTAAHVLGPGVDVRGSGGFILGAGSTIDGTPYMVVHERRAPSVPDQRNGDRNTESSYTGAQFSTEGKEISGAAVL